MTDLDQQLRVMCPLNPIELSLIRHIANGDTRVMGARACGLSPNSINATMTRIFHKIGAASSANAVATALRHGWIA